MTPTSLQTLKNNINQQAYIARETEERLREHLPQNFSYERKLDILRMGSVSEIMEGKLTYKDSTFDYIIAHLVALWQKNLTHFLEEMWRLLSPSGVFLFSTLGKKQAYELEILGDLLLKIGFAFSVVDKDVLQLHYDDMRMLDEDLRLSGLSHDCVDIFSENSDDIIVNIELIYSYVSGKQMPASALVQIPVSSIKRRS